MQCSGEEEWGQHSRPVRRDHRFLGQVPEIKTLLLNRSNDKVVDMVDGIQDPLPPLYRGAVCTHEEEALIVTGQRTRGIAEAAFVLVHQDHGGVTQIEMLRHGQPDSRAGTGNDDNAAGQVHELRSMNRAWSASSQPILPFKTSMARSLSRICSPNSRQYSRSSSTR